MNGVLVHSTKPWYIETLLEEGRLKPSSVTKNEKGNDYLGSNIFFELVPEDISLKSKNSIFSGGSIQLIFKPDILEKYGKKKYRPTSYDKELEEFQELPKRKVWFSNEWVYGKFYKPHDIYESVNYNPKVSLYENIKLFRDLIKNSSHKKYKQYFDLTMMNEVVIQSRSIPLKNNLLVIFIKSASNDKIEKYRKDYSEYIFTNNCKELDTIINNYYQSKL
jgi:hypothetical protein